MARSRDDAPRPVRTPVLSAAEDFSCHPPFEQRGEPGIVPFVLSSPHSGRFYPQRFLGMSRLDAATIRRSEDAFVDELFAGAVNLGAPLLSAHFPRAYLDVNREPFELDPRMFVETLPTHANIRSARVAGGLGTIPRLVGEGLEIYGARLPLNEALGRIEHVYKPFHDALKRLITRTHSRFGFAVLVDCHSMPASVRSGESGTRPDFIVGDRFGTSASADLSHAAIRFLAGMGYTVAHNKPYAGGFITEHYGRPGRNLHALQIEVNRSLYMNERTLRKSPGFEALAQDLTRLLRGLMGLPDECFAAMPLAAE